MQKIIGNRGTGKTKELIELARKVPFSAILTKDKRGLEVKAHNYGYTDVAIYDYEDLEKDIIPIDCNLMVHQSESLLAYLMERYYNRDVYAITMTMPVEKKNRR